MATMFPSDVTDFSTPGGGAVYRFLRQAARPDADFLVWYSPDIEDREPDFILLSPDCGLIVLEVKDWLAGQLLEADPKTALLRMGDREERRKQPLAQAREYVNNLMSLLGRGTPGAKGRRRPCPVTWGAVFPHMRREEFEASGLNTVMDGTCCVGTNCASALPCCAMPPARHGGAGCRSTFRRSLIFPCRRKMCTGCASAFSR